MPGVSQSLFRLLAEGAEVELVKPRREDWARLRYMEGCEEPTWEEQEVPGAQTRGVTQERLRMEDMTEWELKRSNARDAIEEESNVIQEWLTEELKAGTVERVRYRPKGVSPVFIIPKKDGESYRVIHDLRFLNAHTRPASFRMDNLSRFQTSLSQYRFGTTLDLKDAFRHVRIRTEYRGLFGFQFQGQYYQQCCLPFGWRASPRLWNKIASAITDEASRRGITMIMYVDDIAVLAMTAQECKRATDELLALLKELGMIVNLKKSKTEPAQAIRFLGYVLKLEEGAFMLEKEKIRAIRQAAARELMATWTTRARMARLIGMLQGARLALPYLNVKTAYIYRFALKNSYRGWRESLPRWQQIRWDLLYWARLKQWQATQRYREGEQRSVVSVVSDASGTGHGLELSKGGKLIATVSEAWNEEQMGMHSTAKEATAVKIGLQRLASGRLIEKGAMIIWRTDCVAAQAVMAKFRTRSTALFKIGVDIARILARNRWMLRPERIAGAENVRADYLSREGVRDMDELRIRREVMEGIQRAARVRYTVDLCASADSHMMHRYVTRYHDPLAVGVDARVFDWEKEVPCGR